MLLSRPLKLYVGPSSPPSAVWLKTTSRTPSSPILWKRPSTHGLGQQAPPGRGRRVAPGPAAGEGPAGGVEQDDARVVPVHRPLGPVDPVAVAELVGEAVDPDVPVVAGPEELGAERDLGLDLGVARLGEDQADGGGVSTDEDEVDAAGRPAGPERQGMPAGHPEPVAAALGSLRG